MRLCGELWGFNLFECVIGTCCCARADLWSSTIGELWFDRVFGRYQVVCGAGYGRKIRLEVANA